MDRAIHENSRSSSNNDKRDEDCKLLYLPYVKGISEKIQCGSRHLKLRTVFKSQHTLRESLVRVKQSRPKEERNGVVYEVLYASCDHVYIGV